MGCNWSKLLAQDRCKAYGVPWSVEEDYARHQLKIPAEFVRNGCLTLEDYHKAIQELDNLKSEGKEKPLRYMNKAELQKKAGELGIQFTPEVTRADLIHLISIEQSKLPPVPPQGEVGTV
jgi:hypothetical protein